MTRAHLFNRSVTSYPLMYQTIFQLVSSQFCRACVGDQVGKIAIGDLMKAVAPLLREHFAVSANLLTPMQAW